MLVLTRRKSCTCGSSALRATLTAPEVQLTSNLNSLDGSIGNGPVDGFGGVLYRLGGRLLNTRIGGEEARLAKESLAEHVVDGCGGAYVQVSN